MNTPIYLPLEPERAQHSAMRAFMDYCETQTGRRFADYLQLQDWARIDYLQFWQLFLAWSPLETSGSREPAITQPHVELGRFFPSLRLNYARNLLRRADPLWEDRPALSGSDEEGGHSSYTRRELREAVEHFAGGLARLGVGPGDRVVAIARNVPESMIACLATAALGATWSSVAPDMGEAAMLGRFVQLEPKVMLAHTSFSVHGVKRSLIERIQVLLQAMPSIHAAVMLDNGGDTLQSRDGVQNCSMAQLIAGARLPMEQWQDVGFNDPLFVLFSSGTTGAPKCLMHGAGGTLLEHYKEHVLHSGFGPDEKLFFQTSAGWMMWNWQLSAIACGTHVYVYDGSPTYPTQDALLKLIDRERITVFGTSATYLHALQQMGVTPREIGTFESLHTLQSTGSVLYDAQYDWVRNDFKHVRIHSISGGTDIVGCFVLGNPLLPIYRGESQCVSLGTDVQVMTAEGVRRFGQGELVCLNPFPSRPVGIHGDSDGSRFHKNYFEEHEGMWTHGDQVILHEHGSARILGRSDGTLNVRGVRIGPAEIYSIVLATPGIAQALAVEQIAPREPGGSRLVLLVVLQPGATLDRGLTLRIKKQLSQQGSANHVPAVIAQLSGLPTTHSGKLSEKAVRDVLNGVALSNRAALRNPETLEEIAAHPDLKPQSAAQGDGVGP